tara:strand:+ start:989 stop:1690 length:702 start_codon:yes stop_codon:yes gene_type:complete
MPLNITRVNVNQLMHDPANPRKHDDRNMSAIMQSLREHGQVEPLVVQNSTKMVVGGNARLQSMKNLGWEEVDVVMLDISDEEARKLSISLNRSGELAGWNEEVLAQHLSELSSIDDFEPESLGFTDSEMMKLIAEFDTISSDFEEIDAPEKREQDKMDSSHIDESVVKIPAGLAPEGMKSSHIRMVQLFYNEETEPTFRLRVKRLAQEFSTDNISDTVFQAVHLLTKRMGLDE